MMFHKQEYYVQAHGVSLVTIKENRKWGVAWARSYVVVKCFKQLEGICNRSLIDSFTGYRVFVLVGGFSSSSYITIIFLLPQRTKRITNMINSHRFWYTVKLGQLVSTVLYVIIRRCWKKRYKNKILNDGWKWMRNIIHRWLDGYRTVSCLSTITQFSYISMSIRVLQFEYDI